MSRREFSSTHDPADIARVILLDVQRDLAELTARVPIDLSVTRKPHFIMPFPRDPDFVERPALQAWVKDQYDGSATRMALVGLGGFG